MPRDPYVREKYTREVKTARAVARDYFERFPKDRYEPLWRVAGTCSATTTNFTMRRLREPKAKPLAKSEEDHGHAQVFLAP